MKQAIVCVSAGMWQQLCSQHSHTQVPSLTMMVVTL